jgi:hypothetical protein
MLKTVYDESSMLKDNIFKWHKRFRESGEDVNDDKRHGALVRKRTERKYRENQVTCAT